MSDTTPNPNLIDLARELVEGSMDAKYDLGNTAASNTLLENAAQVYEEAGSPHDANVCRLLIEEEE